MTLEPPSWKFTSCNPATVKLFGVKDEVEFVSLGPWELSPEFQPDGMLSSEKAPKMIQKAMEEGLHYFEWTHKRFNGDEFLATVLLTKTEVIKGQPFLQATVRDITEIKKQEDELKKRLHELEVFNKATMDRELKIVELKKKVKELEKEMEKKMEGKR